MQPIVDDQDQWLLTSAAWVPQVSRSRAVYWKAKVGGKVQYLHRLLAGAGNGELVDHIDGDTINNRRSNLRRCDWSGSNANRQRKRTSRAPYKGITQTPSGRWLAQIMWRKQYHRVGLFDSAELAAAAYDQKAIELHGEFARINNIAG